MAFVKQVQHKWRVIIPPVLCTGLSGLCGGREVETSRLTPCQSFCELCRSRLKDAGEKVNSFKYLSQRRGKEKPNLHYAESIVFI